MKGTKIAVFGDYDCDGVVATALLYHYLLGQGATLFESSPSGNAMHMAVAQKNLPMLKYEALQFRAI